MTFAQAYNEMLKGNKIKRVGWQGYWYIAPQSGSLVIHLADDGELVNTSDNLKQTIENTLAEDWTIMSDWTIDEAIKNLAK